MTDTHFSEKHYYEDWQNAGASAAYSIADSPWAFLRSTSTEPQTEVRRPRRQRPPGLIPYT